MNYVKIAMACREKRVTPKISRIEDNAAIFRHIRTLKVNAKRRKKFSLQERYGLRPVTKIQWARFMSGQGW